MRRAGAALLAALVVACVSHGAPSGRAATSPKPQVTAEPQSTAAASAVSRAREFVSVRAFAGEQSPTTLRGLLGDGSFLYVNALAPDGATVLATVNPVDYLDARRPRTQPTRVVVVDIASGRPTLSRALPSPQHALGPADSDDRWFVWAERDGYALLTDWTIFALDRRDNSIHEVARAPRDVAGAPIRSFVTPHVDNGVVVWAEPVAGPASATPATRLLAARLPGGPAFEVARGTHAVAISWPTVAWVEAREGKLRIVRRHLETGSEQVVAAAEDPTSIAIHGEATAWVDRATRRLWLADTPAANPMLVAEPPMPDSPFQELTLSQFAVGWFSNALPGFYARQERRVVVYDEVGAYVGWTSRAKGRALIWSGRPVPGPQAPPVRDFSVLRLGTGP